MTASRWALTTAVTLCAAGCGPSPEVDLKAAALLEGDWSLVLTVDPAPGLPEPTEFRGTVALLANRAGATAPGVPGLPLNVGVHDLALGQLSPGLGSQGVPEVVGSVAGDSAFLIIGPGAKRPMNLRGRFTTDSIVGRWTAHQRAAPGYSGRFVMKKH